MIFFLQSIKIFILVLFTYSYSGANAPGTPSSSYNNDYYSKKPREFINEKYINQIPIPTQNQIIIQGNKRLEDELILRSSEIEQIGTDDKSLSIAIKKLYKTGYFEDVKIYKSKNIVYINVKENPIVDQISIEGNKEITDDLILEELGTRSRNVFSTDQVKLDSEKNPNPLQKTRIFLYFR